MLINRRHTALALAAAAALPTARAQAAKAPKDIPLEHFFGHGRLTQAVLNPAGTHIALVTGGDGARRRLITLDLATMKTTPAAVLADADVMTATWVNDRRIYLGDNEELSNPHRWRPPQGHAVDVDGQGFKRLEFHVPAYAHPALGEELLYAVPQDKSEGWGFLRLQRLNTQTGARREITLPPWTQYYLVDKDGEPAVAYTARGEKAQLRWCDDRKAGNEGWRVLVEWDQYEFGNEIWPVGLSDDGTLYVTTRAGQDRSALYTLDTKTGALGERPVLGLAQFDMYPRLVWHGGKLVGAHVVADAPVTVWFDATWKTVQAKVDAKLPATANKLQIPRQGDSPWVLVDAVSDTRPWRAFAYHRGTDRLVPLGGVRPQIDPATQSATEFVHYKARDGRTIPAYLTLPRSAGEAPKNLPLIVWSHGGPHVRGTTWGWDEEIQFLASRGYAVLQPEFRGGDGFGFAHLQAGFKQWGLAMQDDLADGAQWAIDKGYANPKRIAIMGASYGGYAAMMGLVRHPDLYRCAVNWVGVTDLELLFTASWSDVPGIAKRLGYGKLIGDVKQDAERIKATSPVHQAAKITQPVLMAYGRWDLRVPREHGFRMRDALSHNKQMEWVMYEHEGHGWYWQDTKFDFWSRVEKFLARHL